MGPGSGGFSRHLGVCSTFGLSVGLSEMASSWQRSWASNSSSWSWTPRRIIPFFAGFRMRHIY
ncbi:hypothetical protein CRG98_023251 [Punica granatum]|uniref:Uncharacterized protein n=1 Tax=Punica granatum TaxID=22663 RepID=A0A2I0JLE2_PUNGR|nr:hypothetical protein CRG98_023251 [Punica granatum]